MSEAAGTVKGGEHMKANCSGKGVICIWFLHFFVCSTLPVLHSLQQMAFTLNGVPWKKKTHLEPIFGKVIILSRQSRWKSVHCLTKLQVATPVFYIYLCPWDILSALLWKCIILDMGLPGRVPITWIFSASIKLILITFIRNLLCGSDTRSHEIEKWLPWKATLAWDTEASIICVNHWDVTHLCLLKLVINGIMEVSTFLYELDHIRPWFGFIICFTLNGAIIYKTNIMLWWIKLELIRKWDKNLSGNCLLRKYTELEVG